MPLESADSSQQASPVPPDAAAAPPRTPTGRLQPTSAFRQRNSSPVTPQPGSSQEESTALPDEPRSVAPASGMPNSPPFAAGTTLPAPASPTTTPPSGPAPPAAPSPATVGQGGEESVAPAASGAEGRRRSRSSHRSQSRRGSAAGRANSRNSTRVTQREGTQFSELAAIDLDSAHVDGSSLRELSGLLMAFGLSVALTQASLWWVVGVDPLGIAPLIEQWLPGVVPPGLRS